MDFVEICNVCARKAIIEADKRIVNSDKVCHSYSDLNFGVTFFGTQCISSICTYIAKIILNLLPNNSMRVCVCVHCILGEVLLLFTLHCCGEVKSDRSCPALRKC